MVWCLPFGYNLQTVARLAQPFTLTVYKQFPDSEDVVMQMLRIILSHCHLALTLTYIWLSAFAFSLACYHLFHTVLHTPRIVCSIDHTYHTFEYIIHPSLHMCLYRFALSQTYTLWNFSVTYLGYIFKNIYTQLSGGITLEKRIFFQLTECMGRPT